MVKKRLRWSGWFFFLVFLTGVYWEHLLIELDI